MSSELVGKIVIDWLSIANAKEIFLIEQEVQLYPWTEQKFHSCFESGYLVIGAKDFSQQLIAYCVLMPVVDELHILNIAVKKQWQCQGIAKAMLNTILDWAKTSDYLSLLLEVRVSNQFALRLYTQFGFTEIGRRRDYYPAALGQREDALVMRKLCKK